VGVLSGVFGEQLVDAIRRSRIVINIHFYTGPSVLEQSRLGMIVANEGYAVSESSDDTVADQEWAPYVDLVPYDDLVWHVTCLLRQATGSISEQDSLTGPTRGGLRIMAEARSLAFRSQRPCQELILKSGVLRGMFAGSMTPF
jgi:hypothetical protein